MTGLVVGLLLVGAISSMVAYGVGVGNGAQRSLAEVLRARADAADARRAIHAITRDTFERMVERATEPPQFRP